MLICRVFWAPSSGPSKEGKRRSQASWQTLPTSSSSLRKLTTVRKSESAQEAPPRRKRARGSQGVEQRERAVVPDSSMLGSMKLRVRKLRIKQSSIDFCSSLIHMMRPLLLCSPECTPEFSNPRGRPSFRRDHPIPCW